MPWTISRSLLLPAVLLAACGSSSPDAVEDDTDAIKPGDGDGSGATGDGDNGGGAVGADDPIKGPGGGDGDAQGDGDVQGDGDATSGDAGVSGDGDEGKPDAATPPVDCQDGACCVDGKEYLPEAKNPDNACQWCDPAQSTSAFSPADGIACGTGCSCSAGKATESLCSDDQDNDGDNRLNCADADCGGKVCQPKTTVHVLPSADLQGSQPPVGMATETDGTATLTLQSANGAKSYAVLEFDSIANNGSLEIASAVLNLTVEGTAQVSLRDANDKEIDKKAAVAGGSLTFDVTKLVQGWAEGNGQAQRVTLHVASGGVGLVLKLHATEYDGTDSDPYLYMSYEASCSGGKCPAP